VVVCVINYHSLKADRGKGVKDLFHILGGLFGTADTVRRHAASLVLAISQAPTMHPETGLPLTLDHHRALLLDPSGLDQAAAGLLAAIERENVVVFHLLDKGGPSWLGRGQIISRIRALVPIAKEPGGSLFRSAIDDADKERLRALAKSLGDAVKRAVGGAGGTSMLRCHRLSLTIIP
jgi:hypothetical protein